MSIMENKHLVEQNLVLFIYLYFEISLGEYHERYSLSMNAAGSFLSSHTMSSLSYYVILCHTMTTALQEDAHSPTEK